MSKNLIPKDWGDHPPKIIILGDANLAILKGFKATAERKGGLIRGKSRLVITIPDLSFATAERLVAELKPLPPEEIREFKNKLPIGDHPIVLTF